jgi:hypothetical protein
MIVDDKQIQEFFQSLKNYDSDMLTIEEFKNEVKKVQGKFEENE